MRKSLSITLTSLLIGTLLVSPVFSKSHRINLGKDATLYGVQLETGKYRLILEDNIAELYRGKDLVVRAEVVIEPIESKLHNYCHICDGELKEIGLKKTKVMFVKRLDPTE
jgi:hypothetical protein